MSARSVISTTRYLDSVLDVLEGAGVAVVTVEVDLNPAVPFHARLVTQRGTVLMWDEETGWSAEGDTTWHGMRATGPL